MKEPFRPKLSYVAEPNLAFRYGQQLEYSRDGLYLYGPVDATNIPRTVKYGFIGTNAGLERFKRWAREVSSYIGTPPRRRGAKELEPHHVPFPGFAEAFNATWSETPTRVISDIDESDLHRRMHIANRHEAIKSVVDVFVDRLIADRKRDLPVRRRAARGRAGEFDGRAGGVRAGAVGFLGGGVGLRQNH